jgi:hypothetical protein
MILFLVAAAAAQPADTPKAYMERVYASYRNSNFNPLDHPNRYFARRLVSAMSEDVRLARGEVGYVDGDPICQCQDPDGLHAKVTRVIQQGAAKAIAEVIIDFTDSTARRVKFSLVRTPAGWRIADISSPDEPSFLRAIEEANRKARAKH